MKKKTILISSLATALIAGGYIGYVQIAPQYIDTPSLIMNEEMDTATSEKEVLANHISYNFKLNLYSQKMIPELIQKLYHQEEGAEEFIYKKQTELADMISEIEEYKVSSKDSFLQDNQATQLAFADTNKEVLSSALAYYQLHSEENRDKLAQTTDSLSKQLNRLIDIKEEVAEKYDIQIALSGTEDTNKKDTLSDNYTPQVTISYKDGIKSHSIEVK